RPPPAGAPRLYLAGRERHRDVADARPDAPVGGAGERPRRRGRDEAGARPVRRRRRPRRAGVRGEAPRARVRGIPVLVRRAQEPGADAVHAHEQQTLEELTMTRDVVIVSAVRSAVGRAGKGSLALTRPDTP